MDSKRYKQLDLIGRGGMGEVYQVQDRLYNEVIAIKTVTVPGGSLDFASIHTSSDLQVSIAREFSTLASLRHPNIISVLEYGFDDDQQPYFTMEYLQDARTILEASENASDETKLSYFIQLLKALAYLHRRGIIHRDLKPDNVLVDQDDNVKVLDFGLAIGREYLSEDREVAGTLAYLAPEVMAGKPVSEASDLYAVGTILYEMYVGHHPFNIRAIPELVQQIVKEVPDVSAPGIDDNMREIISILMSKNPDDRPQSIIELANLMSRTMELPLQIETNKDRESFLKSARFVARKQELNQLVESLQRAQDTTNLTKDPVITWLVGGESGIGKSRLLSELRINALIEGYRVLIGQAVAEQGASYSMWRPIIRALCLEVELSDLELSVLKAIIPDLNELVGKDIEIAPDLEAQAAQERLLTTIEDIFLRVERPTLLVLEDLQWAQESLMVLQRLSRDNHRYPMVIVGSYRNDELPELPEMIPNAQTMILEKLDLEGISLITKSMLGDVIEDDQQLVNMISQETDGNAFFIVEVIRTLAEEAGNTALIAQKTLPQNVFSQGLKTVIQRRLSFLEDDARKVLEFAAIIGRQLDLNLIQQISPQTNIDDWLEKSADASIIDVQYGTWRFAHDKFREELLATLDDDKQRALHRKVAESIEVTYAENKDYAARLAYHWQHAGNETKEAYYSAIAGENALQNGAYQESVTLMERALELEHANQFDDLRKATLKQKLGDAYMGWGRIEGSRKHLEDALELLGQPLIPESKRGAGMAITGQLLRQIWHRIRMDTLGIKYGGRKDASVVLTKSRATERLAQCYVYMNESMKAAYYTFLGLNLAEVAGPSGLSQSVRFYGSMALAMGVIGRPGMSDRYSRKADQVLETFDDDDAESLVALVVGAFSLGMARWKEAHKRGDVCKTIGNKLGFRRRWEEGAAIQGDAFVYQGKYEEAINTLHELYQSALRSGSLQNRVSAAAKHGLIKVLQGQFDEASELLSKAEEQVSEDTEVSMKITLNGAWVDYHLQRGNGAEASRYASQLQEVLDNTSPTSAYNLAGYSSYVNYCLQQYELDPNKANTERAKKALEHMQAYAKLFYIGKPRASAYQGWFTALNGQHEEAQEFLEQGVEHAKDMEMPFEEGVAYYLLGRFSEEKLKQKYLEQAGTIFETIGAQWFTEQVKAELS